MQPRSALHCSSPRRRRDPCPIRACRPRILGTLRRMLARAVCASFAAMLAAVDASAAPRVHEITMAAPDIVRIEVREDPIQRGRIVKLAGSSNERYGTWIRVRG